MAELKDGERVEVEGSTNWYTIARDGDVYSCTCPAWRHQRVPIEMRSCKHIQAYVGDYDVVAYEPLYDVPNADEASEVRKKREAAVDECLEKYVVFYDRFEELTGLRLPEHVAIFVGFYLALSPEEKTWLDGASTNAAGLRGVARWFEEGLGDHDAEVITRDRQATDPMELFPLYENADGRFGLFYDEPKELPASIAFIGTTMEKASSALLEPTLLRSLYRQRRYRGAGVQIEYGQYTDDIETPENAKLRLATLDWLGACAKREAKTARSRLSRKDGWPMNGGVGPYIRGWVLPKDLEGWHNTYERLTAYQQATKPKIEEWIELAKQDLRDGSPGRALFMGRELHWFAATVYRETACELLIRAYVALGRRPLADITQAHYRKHYPETTVYELPRAHAIVLAAANGDLEAIKSAPSDEAPSAADVAEALSNATNVETVNALLDLDPDTAAHNTDSALWRRLSELERMKGGMLKGGESFLGVRDVVRVLLSRGDVSARAFGKLLGIREEETLITLATSRVDIESHDARGATALHFAAAAARPDIVKALLERGADASAADSRGRKAYESARGAWRNHPREAGEIFALLEAAGGGEKKKSEPPPPPPEWVVGEKVTHAKFGGGVIELITGIGDETKLKIKFGKKNEKTLLAKFVAKT
jgi:hypothetical protein